MAPVAPTESVTAKCTATLEEPCAPTVTDDGAVQLAMPPGEGVQLRLRAKFSLTLI